MASITWRDGRATVQIVAPSGKRRTLGLGRVGKRDAERCADDVESLNDLAKLGRRPSGDLLDRVNRFSSDVKRKLVAYGVLPADLTDEPEAAAVPTLGPFAAGYVKVRSDVKPATATFYGHTERNLVEFFGSSRPLADVTAGDADEFRLWLLRAKPAKDAPKDTAGGQGLSEATARRRCTLASQFFRAAVRKGFITSNPFAGVGGMVKANKARQQFVSREETEKVLAACPDAEWRLLVALARYGGLRTPSEHYGLTWGDVDWERGKFLVHSPKTEHHEGGDLRWVPIFPELRPHLQAVLNELLEDFDPKAARLSEQPIIRRYRNQANLRTRFMKVIRRAGLKPWPKLFQNLRSTRQTELAEKHPLHVVCAWLGNKVAIAAEHYLQVTDADFSKAASEGPASAALALHAGNNSGQLETTDAAADGENAASNSDESSPVVVLSPYGMGVTGLEPVTSTV